MPKPSSVGLLCRDVNSGVVVPGVASSPDPLAFTVVPSPSLSCLQIKAAEFSFQVWLPILDPFLPRGGLMRVWPQSIDENTLQERLVMLQLCPQSASQPHGKVTGGLESSQNDQLSSVL